MSTGGTRNRRKAPYGRLLALVATLLMSSALLTPTAQAHHFTGEVQLWASTVDFRDSPAGVLVTVRLIERESGEAVSGFGVTVTATGEGGSVGPIELQESEFAVYSGALRLTPGEWEIRVRTHQGRSALPAIESAHRKAVEIDAAGRLVATDAGGSATATTLAIVLPVCAVVLILLVVLRRRRSATEEVADTEDGPPGDDVGVAETGGEPLADRDIR